MTTKIKGLVEIPDSVEDKQALHDLSNAWWAHAEVSITVHGHTYPLHVSLVEAC